MDERRRVRRTRVYKSAKISMAGSLCDCIVRDISSLGARLAEAVARAGSAVALRPGVRGLSSRIRVRSVIGRFLEHSRIFVFGNGGKTEVYLGSADWMHRNIYERVEVMFHLKEPGLCDQILREVVTPYMRDTQKTRFLMPTGEYVRAHQARKLIHLKNGFRFNAQEFLIGFAEGRDVLASIPSAPGMFRAPSIVVSTNSV